MTWKKILDKLLNISKWKRLFVVVAFVLVKWGLNFVINAVVIVQMLCWLWSGEVFEKLNLLTKLLNSYLLQVVKFITFQSETLPWPIGDLPDEEEPCLPKK